MKSKTSKTKEKNFHVVNPKAAGIDIGSMVHYVAVSRELDDNPIRHFSGFTSDLEALASWLVSLGITTVAMESTGNYWLSLYEILEANGIKVCLVNARHMKNVSGRKTDVSDCQWLQQLHTFGLLSASFIPEDLIRQLRCYVRQRNNIEIEKAKDLQHIQRSLTNMNVKLQHIISDIEGVAGMKIITDISRGITDCKELAKHRSSSMKASLEEIEQSLKGNYTSEHLFTLKQAINTYHFHLSQMKECEIEIEKMLQLMSTGKPVESAKFESRSKSRKTRKNQYKFDLRTYLIEILGVDLTKVEGLDENTVLEVISETGTDLTKWRTHKHFTSWLKLCPNPAKSGGKILGNKGGRSSSRAAKAFRLAARCLHSSNHYLGALYRRISHRKGAPTAIKAVARKLAVIFYKMVIGKVDYIKTEIKDYQEKYKAKIIKNLRKKAEALGMELRETSLFQGNENQIVA